MKPLGLAFSMIGIGIILHWTFLHEGIDIAKGAFILLILGILFK